MLVSRPISKDGSNYILTASAADLDAEQVEPDAPSMLRTEAKTMIEGDSKEFFSLRNPDQGEVYFARLPVEHRHLLVDKLVTRAIKLKDADAQLVANLFHRACSKNLCSPAAFEKGFIPTARKLDDATKAFRLFAIMFNGAGLDTDAERRARIASVSVGNEEVFAILLLLSMPQPR